VATIPPFLLALAEFGPGRALLVVVCITVVNLGLENIVMPRMVGARLSITPTVSVVSFVFWTWLLGAGGALLALFLTMLLITILDSFERTRWIAGVLTTEVSPAPADSATPSPIPAAVDGQIPA
jgi:predicted PurR-regulated permease PerM